MFNQINDPDFQPGVAITKGLTMEKIINLIAPAAKTSCEYHSFSSYAESHSFSEQFPIDYVKQYQALFFHKPVQITISQPKPFIRTSLNTQVDFDTMKNFIKNQEDYFKNPRTGYNGNGLSYAHVYVRLDMIKPPIKFIIPAGYMLLLVLSKVGGRNIQFDLKFLSQETTPARVGVGVINESQYITHKHFDLNLSLDTKTIYDSNPVNLKCSQYDDTMKITIYAQDKCTLSIEFDQLGDIFDTKQPNYISLLSSKEDVSSLIKTVIPQQHKIKLHDDFNLDKSTQAKKFDYVLEVGMILVLEVHNTANKSVSFHCTPLLEESEMKIVDAAETNKKLSQRITSWLGKIQC